MSNDQFVENIALTGEEIDNLENKGFVILGHRIEETEFKKDESDEVEIKRKQVLSVSLNENKAVVDYYPNLTSIKTLVAKFGRDKNKWLEKQAEWKVKDMLVNGQDKKVPFVKQ